MQTICKECIFNHVENGVQTGCEFDNRLQKYIDKNLAAKNDNWYYTINTLCKACTTKHIGQVLPEDYKDIVRKKITPKIDAVLYGEDNDIKSVLKLIKQDNYNSIIIALPKVIDIRLHFELLDILPSLIISSQLENRYDLEYIDNACLKSKADFVVIFNCSDTHYSPTNVVKTVVDMCLNQLLDLIAIFPEKNEIHGLLINPKVFRFLNGNFGESIINKIKSIPNYESMIAVWTTNL